jgi:DNA-directed RNA polymerase specialized sigma24 family protein
MLREVDPMAGRDYTDMGGTGYVFLTTHWSLVEGVQSSSGRDDALIGTLLRQYWKPVYCYLRREGCENEQAKDLTQGFFHEVVLNRGLLERADRSKGRFRAFLLHALDQYVINERTREKTRKRSPKGGLVPLDMAEPPALPQSISSMTPEDCYNYTWLSDLLERVLAEVAADCRSDGLDLHWTVFHEKLIGPILEDTSPPSAQELCQKHGIEDEKKVSNMLVTVKRRFETAIRKHVRNTVADDNDVEDEVQELFQYLP